MLNLARFLISRSMRWSLVIFDRVADGGLLMGERATDKPKVYTLPIRNKENIMMRIQESNVKKTVLIVTDIHL
jgi:hypothetical protein